MTLLSLRTRMSMALLERVAGPDGAEVQHKIHRTPGPRWFEPGSPIRRVHGDASMYIGGLRALLLQSLHPLPMAAVAAHSGYRSDPWGRLASTATFIATTTFGTADDAQHAIDIVRAVHSRISGYAPDDRRYTADDPHLLLWVHCAEIESFLVAHQIFGACALKAREVDTYIEQSAVVAIKLGAEPEKVPRNSAELRQTMAGFRPELEGTDAARDVATFLLREAPIPRPARGGYRMLTRAAVAILPSFAREMLDLPDRPLLYGTVHRLAGHAGTAAMRWLTDAEPMRHPPPHEG